MHFSPSVSPTHQASGIFRYLPMMRAFRIHILLARASSRSSLCPPMPHIEKPFVNTPRHSKHFNAAATMLGGRAELGPKWNSSLPESERRRRPCWGSAGPGADRNDTPRIGFLFMYMQCCSSLLLSPIPVWCACCSWYLYRYNDCGMVCSYVEHCTLVTGCCCCCCWLVELPAAGAKQCRGNVYMQS